MADLFYASDDQGNDVLINLDTVKTYTFKRDSDGNVISADLAFIDGVIGHFTDPVVAKNLKKTADLIARYADDLRFRGVKF